MNDEWNISERRALECVRSGPYELRTGDRVCIRPRARADILDIALAGKTATIETIEQDFDDRVYLALTVDDDPGADLGEARMIGHRFYFRPEEVAPLDASKG